MKTIKDLHVDIEAAFPGKVHGVALKDGTISVNHWVDGIKQSDQDAVNALIATYDFSAPTKQDLNNEIEAKLNEAAQDKLMTDEDFVAYKNKLLRTQHIDKVEDKQAKIAEAEALKG